MIFSMSGPRPGIFSIMRVRVYQNTKTKKAHRSSSRSSWPLHITSAPNSQAQATVYVAPESLNVSTCHKTACSSWGLISSGLLPPEAGSALILSMLSISRCISRSSLPPGNLNRRSRRLVNASCPPPLRDVPPDLALALSSSAFRSVTEAWYQNRWGFSGYQPHYKLYWTYLTLDKWCGAWLAQQLWKIKENTNDVIGSLCPRLSA